MRCSEKLQESVSKARLVSLQKRITNFCDGSRIAFTVSPDGYAFVYPSHNGAMVLDESKGGLRHPVDGSTWKAAVLIRSLWKLAEEVENSDIGFDKFLKTYKPKGWSPRLGKNL